MELVGTEGGETEGTWLQLLRSCALHLLQVSHISKAECIEVGNYQVPEGVKSIEIRDLEQEPKGKEESDKKIQYWNCRIQMMYLGSYT